ncbi:MAG: 4-(cytidine 5'-diphospho)-2-C-methyl-D-erythritol kinase [Bacteroidota bacterium]
MPVPFTHRAYAKVNIGLYITGKRPDGYHDILTVFHRVNLFDEIRLEPATTIEVTSTSADAPGGETNLCHKAAVALQRFLRISDGVSIHITKNIPVGAGLGGGSSDAAIVLQQLPAVWNRTVVESDLRRIALRLGSDIPYFLGQGSAIASGRGDVLEYFPIDVPFTILLCYPDTHVSTAWAYQHMKPGGGPTKEELMQLLQHGMSDPIAFSGKLRNDFEEVVFKEFPKIQQVKQQITDGGAAFALMSGSGSSVFGIFRNTVEAKVTAEKLEQRGYRTFLTGPHFRP